MDLVLLLFDSICTQADEGIDYGITQFAAWLDIREMEPILYMYNLLNQYGIDTVSFAANVAWAMDCYERGIITKETTGGLPLNWGDYETAIALVHLIAKREGFGRIIGEGEKRAPELVDRESEKYMYHVKGMTPVVEDPRVMKGFGLGYCTSTRGGDHLRALYMRAFGKSFVKNVFPKIPSVADDHVPKGKGVCVKWLEDYCAALDSCNVCKRPWLNVLPDPLERMLDMLTRFVSAVTGFEMNGTEILRVGERIYNVEKAFNSREGLTRKDDNFTNPEKFTKEPVKDGPGRGLGFERDEMLNEYYRARGWDHNGVPTQDKIKDLEVI